MWFIPFQQVRAYRLWGRWTGRRSENPRAVGEPLRLFDDEDRELLGVRVAVVEPVEYAQMRLARAAVDDRAGRPVGATMNGAERLAVGGHELKKLQTVLLLRLGLTTEAEP